MQDLIKKSIFRNNLCKTHSEMGFVNKTEIMNILNNQKVYNIQNVINELENIKRITNSIGNYNGVTKEKFDILNHVNIAMQMLKEVNNE